MHQSSISPLLLRLEVESWPLKTPFRITGHIWRNLDVLVVSLEGEGRTGRGEAAGVYYRGETPARMREQIEALRPRIEAGITRESLQRLLPPGGARNALDCALWDLTARLERRAVWRGAGLPEPRPLLTTFTCGADTPAKMAENARSYVQARAIKLKLTGESSDADRVRAVREARPEVWLGVDANQGFTLASIERLIPVLMKAGVRLIEQPFPIGHEGLLDGLDSPIPVAADESAQSAADIPALAGRVNVVNIKLDKCGGLTEGLAMARTAKAHGLDLMVGNMLGTSLAMAPAFLLGQLCQLVDLDGPVFLARDRSPGISYSDGRMHCSEEIWGS